MRINQYLQLAAFTLGLIIPLALLWTADWPQVAALTGYIWLIGFLAALWDRYTWRRRE